MAVGSSSGTCFHEEDKRVTSLSARTPIADTNTGINGDLATPQGHKELLNIIHEVRTQGAQLQAVREAEFHGRWARMKAVMDSGATVTVIPPAVGKLYEVTESEASKRGVQYEVASGDSLPNLGEKFLPLLTKENTVRGMLAQVADITMPLQSARAMHASGHIVVLDGPDSFVFNKLTGEVNCLEDDGTNYFMDMWIVPPEDLDAHLCQDFPRQP